LQGASDGGGLDGQFDDPLEEYLDQIDDLTHKLSVAESKLKSLQSETKSSASRKFENLFSVNICRNKLVIEIESDFVLHVVIKS